MVIVIFNPQCRLLEIETTSYNLGGHFWVHTGICLSIWFDGGEDVVGNDGVLKYDFSEIPLNS